MIRLAHIEDAKAIADVHIRSWQAIYRGHIPDEVLDQLSLEKRTEEWKALLEQGVEIFVVEDSSDIIGFGSICPSRDQVDDAKRVAEISSIYFLPKFWRCGYGKALCEHLFTYILKKGYKEIMLWVLESNHTSRQFYEALGFYVTGDVKLDHFESLLLQEVKYRKKF